MYSIVLFISTGRCGTQWLNHTLDYIYGSELEVRHEPLGWNYAPRQFIRAYDRINELYKIDIIRKHIDEVSQITDNRPYIETGWPAYPLIPLFKSVFGDRLRLIHIVRNPIAVAWSLVTHGFYTPKKYKDTNFVNQVLLAPEDPGVIQSYYCNDWTYMDPFEKCLFYWSEINLYGLELEQRYPNTPFIRVRFEDLLSNEQTMRHLISHLNLEWRNEIVNLTKTKIDKHSHKTTEPVDWAVVNRHPQALALSLRFGYNSFSRVNSDYLSARYMKRKSLREKIIRRIRDLVD